MGIEVAKRVTVWTEGGSSIGMGHIARCVNLSHALKQKGIDSMYFVNNDLSTMEILKGKGLGYRICSIEQVQGIFNEDDVVVIDTKKDVPGQVEFLKCRGRKVVLIDNNTSAADLADLVVVPSPFFDGKKDSQSARVKGGPEYIMIGDGFHDKRGESLMLEYSMPLKVLVTMGGADPNHIAEKIVYALTGFEGAGEVFKSIEIDVVAGPASEPADSIFEAERASEGIVRIHRELTDLAPLMAGAHLAFTALGTTINELAFMGVPSLVISNYFDDTRDLAKVEELGIGLGLGHHSDVTDSDIVGAVERFVKDKALWDSVRTRSVALTDGLGAGRVAALIAAEVGN